MAVKKRNGEIDLWKFLMSVIIIIYHGHHFTDSAVFPCTGGALAVEFFFVVSGYLMAASLAKRREYAQQAGVGKAAGEYIWHKFAGMYPEYLIAWIISFAVLHVRKSWTLWTLLKDALTGVWEMLFVREAGITYFRANAVTWYISAMMIAMLVLVPLMLWNWELFMRILAPLISMILLGYCYQNFGGLRGPVKWDGSVREYIVRQQNCVLDVSAGLWCRKSDSTVCLGRGDVFSQQYSMAAICFSAFIPGTIQMELWILYC